MVGLNFPSLEKLKKFVSLPFNFIIIITFHIYIYMHVYEEGSKKVVRKVGSTARD